MSEKIDMIGKRFGRLTVIREDGKDARGNLKYLCKCDCGNEVTVRGYSLRSGDCQSCGCFRKEASSERNSTHGHSNERLYSIWRNMLKRCYYPKHEAYERYGGRGIEVCKEWKESYETFKEFMLSHGYDEYGLPNENTLDRIDNDGNYCPENCRVVSMKKQSLNKSNNHYITYKLKKMTVTEAAAKNGLTSHQVYNRLDKGWDMGRALHQPLTGTRTFTVNEETHTVQEWADIFGITYSALNHRLDTKTIEEIYKEWKAGSNQLKVGDFSVKLERADGKVMNRLEWSKFIGITVDTLRKLLKEHTMQEIYDDWKEHDGRLSFIRSNKLEEANGEAHTRKEWSRILGIAEKTLRNRLKKQTMQEVYDDFKYRIKELS